jgi:hypothetical protein
MAHRLAGLARRSPNQDDLDDIDPWVVQ